MAQFFRGAVVISRPTISGALVIGTQLTTTDAGPFQWTRDGVDIVGATSASYQVTGLDIGPTIRLRTPNGLSAGLAYLPTDEGATCIEWLDPSQLAAGPVATYTGRKNVLTLTAAGAARPTMSTTGFNGTPGVTGDGVSNVMSGLFNLSAYSTLRIVRGIVDTATTSSVILEHTTNAQTQDGGFKEQVDVSGASQYDIYARGSTDFGLRGYTTDLNVPQVVTGCVDTSVPQGSPYARSNNFTMTSFGIISNCGPGNFANATFSLFARSGGVSPWAGTLGHIVFLSGNAQDAALDRVERFVAYKSGLAPWIDVMCCGDSITLGLTMNLGAWRAAAGYPAANTILGAHYLFVGPYFTVGYHRGVTNERASQVAADLPTFAAQLALFQPVKVVLAWGTNDLGNGRTPAQLFADMTAIVGQVRTTFPLCHIVMPSVVPPGPASAYYANIANYVTYKAAQPAFCAGLSTVASPVTYVDIGAPTLEPDGIHPTSDASGYGIMAAPIAAGLLA